MRAEGVGPFEVQAGLLFWANFPHEIQAFVGKMPTLLSEPCKNDGQNHPHAVVSWDQNHVRTNFGNSNISCFQANLKGSKPSFPLSQSDQLLQVPMAIADWGLSLPGASASLWHGFRSIALTLSFLDYLLAAYG